MPGPGPGGLRWLAPEEERPRGLHGPEVEALLVCAEGPHALLVQPPQREWGCPHTLPPGSAPRQAVDAAVCPPQDDKAAGLLGMQLSLGIGLELEDGSQGTEQDCLVTLSLHSISCQCSSELLVKQTERRRVQ